MNIMRSIFTKPQGNNATLNSDQDWSKNIQLAVYSRRDTHLIEIWF